MGIGMVASTYLGSAVLRNSIWRGPW
jgi:hypothetical protein